jgi:hypothetical protein
VISIEIKASLLSFLLTPFYFLICSNFVAVMDRYFSIRDPATTEDLYLAPSSINPKAEGAKEVEEFKLQGSQYIRCSALTKPTTNTKQRSSPIWKWGEDIQLVKNPNGKIFFYCYLCEKWAINGFRTPCKRSPYG